MYNSSMRMSNKELSRIAANLWLVWWVPRTLTDAGYRHCMVCKQFQPITLFGADFNRCRPCLNLRAYNAYWRRRNRLALLKASTPEATAKRQAALNALNVELTRKSIWTSLVNNNAAC